MDIEQLLEDVNEKMEDFVSTLEETNAAECGLDYRAGYRLFVNRDCIVVTDTNTDRTLQYYGGFEYVDKEYRKEIGDYVIYLSDNGGRVDDHINHFYDKGDSEE